VSTSNSNPQVPKHVAVIMDGNGRWAKKRLFDRLEGHRQGAKTVRMLVEECRKKGIRYLTLYSFSSENWSRPAAEVSGLMALFERYLKSEVAELKKNGVRLRAIGELARLPSSVQSALNLAMAGTADCTGLDLILAISYGGRSEIVSATKKLLEDFQNQKISIDQVDERALTARLYAPDVPDPELVIRTSGEMRISNFLLWQVAYSELVVSPLLWPDFSAEEFTRCLAEFGGRGRRFGKTGDQVLEEQCQPS
jgi:undecaprenyl diphosphate synthase